MAIDSGYRKILESQRKSAAKLRVKTSSEIQCRLFSILRSIPGRTVSEHQLFCNNLCAYSIDEQRRLILESYGAAALAKCQPLLQQLVSIPPDTQIYLGNT